MKRFLIAAIALGASVPLQAAERYVIDTEGMHAFVNFKISHLGYSWLYGRFNDFSGEFTYDPDNPENSSVEVTIDTASVDSNHERRDEHLRNADFLDVSNHPQARFESTAFVPRGDGRYELRGDFTFLGETHDVSIDVNEIGAGEDPWGNYRRGFEGSVTLDLDDIGIDYELPSADSVEIILSIEGVRQDEG
jgi:polyisoprenoid-binding protein YceI